MVKDNVIIRPSTRADIDKFFDGQMRDTCRAWSVLLDGELVCVAGVSITPHLMLAFCQIAPGISVSKRTVWLHAQAVWEKMKGLGYPMLYAVADPKEPNAAKFLKRLGFEHLESSVRGEVYRWIQ